jgi:pimeloyl-ACP methyl ester carboxylesterase
MTHSRIDEESNKAEPVGGHAARLRRELLKGGIALTGALGMGVGFNSMGAAALAEPVRAPRSGPSPRPAPGLLDAASEAKKIAFDRIGNGENLLLISGFPQTRLSWNRLIPLLSQKFQTIPADLPSFGDSGILSAPATTENVGRIFHEFVTNLGVPLHVVAHDFGAWCAYSWALLFPKDFKSLTLIEAGIPGITLLNDIQLSDLQAEVELHLSDAARSTG